MHRRKLSPLCLCIQTKHMKKILLKMSNRFGTSFANWFAALALFVAYSNDHRCLFYLGEAKKTENVTPDNIKALFEKSSNI